MWKRWLVSSSVFVVLLLGMVGIYLWLRFSPTSGIRQVYQPVRTELVVSPAPVDISNDKTDKVEWAKTMLAKFPYKKELYAGILPSKRPEEVWFVGKGGLDTIDPKTFLVIDLGGDAMRIKITPQTEFTTQVDADLGSDVEVASWSAIKLGDLLIIKATVEGENVIALTIRKLNIVNSP